MRSRMGSVARRVCVVATVTVLSVVTFGAFPASAVYPPKIYPCNLQLTIAELTNYGSNKPRNIVVYIGSAKDSAKFEGVVRKGSGKERGCNEIIEDGRTYYWVIFSGKGTFVRKGDGGYRNWAFTGRFKRVSDKKVTFQPI